MADERAADAAVVTPPPRAIVPLSDTECRAVLERQRLCVVSVVDDGEPYAVPVFYGFDGRTLFLGVAEGRKTRALDVSARVYIVVTEVGPGDAWRSVAIAGRARTLTDGAERQAAVDVLVEHNRRVRVSDASRGTPARRSGGRVLRIEDAVVTGRAFS